MSLGPALFRREKIIDKNGKLLVSCPEDTAAFEDFAFICRYLNQCNGIWERLPFYGYQYCKHEKSLTSKRWSPQELSHALEPVLAIGEGMGDPGFISHKLQYAFRFLALWYEEAFRQGKWDSFKKWPGRKSVRRSWKNMRISIWMPLICPGAGNLSCGLSGNIPRQVGIWRRLWGSLECLRRMIEWERLM